VKDRALDISSILHVDCSPRVGASFSRWLGGELMARLATLHPGARVVTRDLAADPPPYVDEGRAIAMLMPPEQRGEGEAAALACSEVLIGELEASDMLVISTPMHNYSVPAPLKAWIDHVVRIRRTFRSTPEGKIGLLRDRPTLVVTAAGGFHSAEPARQPDFLTPYLRAILATLGIGDVAFHNLEGMGRGPDTVARALDGARAWLDERLPLGF
jgi:FMN-dependent NADH-azoreductase